jgi:hypothetical protein
MIGAVVSTKVQSRRRQHGWSVPARLLTALCMIFATFTIVTAVNVSIAAAAGPTPQFDVPGVVTADASGVGAFYGVSCPSATSCIAVGEDGSTAGDGIYSIGTHTDGYWTWSTSTVITPDSSGGGLFEAISCASASACIAVGEDDSGQAIYASGTGSGGIWTWSTSKVVPADGSGLGFFAKVSCASATTCVAVGQDGASSPQEIFSSGTESGGAWTWTSSTVIAPTLPEEGRCSA